MILDSKSVYREMYNDHLAEASDLSMKECATTYLYCTYLDDQIIAEPGLPLTVN